MFVVCDVQNRNFFRSATFRALLQAGLIHGMCRTYSKLLLIAVFAGSAPAFAQGLAGDLTPPAILGGSELDIPDEDEDEDDATVVERLDIGKAFKGFKVVKVEVTGNRRVGSDDIRANIGTRVGMSFEPARAARDIRSLYTLGFFSDVKVSLTEAEDGAGVILKFEVVEKGAVNEIKLEGNDELDEEDIMEVVDIELNTPLDIPTIHKNIQKIRDLYLEEGYFLAQVSYRLEEAEGENSYDVIFVMDEHSQVEVRKISFVGNRALSDAEISRYMATRTAGPFSILTDSGKFNAHDSRICGRCCFS